MPARDDLIAAKGEVQARLRALRPRVDAAREAAGRATGLRRRMLHARCNALELELESLMAEEARLRLEIDRAPR